MTIHEAQQQLLFQLYHVYDNREAANIADWVMEHLTGWKKIDRIVNKQVPLRPDSVTQLEQYIQELLTHKPVQYVLHEAWFCGMPFYVDENVLIPRPETEELVQLVIGNRESAIGNKKPEAGSKKYEAGSTTTEADSKQQEGRLQPEASSHLLPPTSYIKILDIGTGSGCIPISLKKKLPNAAIFACDISEKALAVAQKNAASLQTDIQFIQADFLNPASWEQLPAVHIIVSNPPYIPQHNKSSMHANVLEHEPHLALFVPNDDPLLFYKAIAHFAQQKLLPGGQIFAEIHEDLGPATKAMFEEKGFTNVEVKKDFQGKDRMIKAERPTLNA